MINLLFMNRYCNSLELSELAIKCTTSFNRFSDEEFEEVQKQNRNLDDSVVMSPSEQFFAQKKPLVKRKLHNNGTGKGKEEDDEEVKPLW